MTSRRAWPAAIAVLLLVVGQWTALAHQATTRHVTCSEHGEELDAATLADPSDGCEHDHWVGVEDVDGDHHDCAMARALQQNSAAAKPFIAPHVTHTLTAHAFVVRTVTPTADLVLIAPKTSPPV